MDISVVKQNISFTIDPLVQGYDPSFWKTLAGTPTVVAGAILLNADEMVSFSGFRYLDLEFVINVPVAPVAGQAKSWGLKIPSYGNRSRIEFQIVDDVFSVVCYDDYGTVVVNQTIVWDATWTAANVFFRILVSKLGVKFGVGLVSAGKPAFLSQLIEGQTINTMSGIPNNAQMIHVNNTNGDNLQVFGITVRNVESLTP